MQAETDRRAEQEAESSRATTAAKAAQQRLQDSERISALARQLSAMGAPEAKQYKVGKGLGTRRVKCWEAGTQAFEYGSGGGQYFPSTSIHQLVVTELGQFGEVGSRDRVTLGSLDWRLHGNGKEFGSDLCIRPIEFASAVHRLEAIVERYRR